MVRRDARPDESERGRQDVIEIDFEARLQQVLAGVEAGRAGSYYGYSEASGQLRDVQPGERAGDSEEGFSRPVTLSRHADNCPQTGQPTMGRRLLENSTMVS